MRSFILGFALIAAIGAAAPDATFAVGVVRGGPDKIQGAYLEDDGTVPDTLNKIKEALVIFKLTPLVERLAGEIKLILGQFGIRSTRHSENKQYRVVSAKHIKKKRRRKKRRRIKVPRRAK